MSAPMITATQVIGVTTETTANAAMARRARSIPPIFHSATTRTWSARGSPSRFSPFCQRGQAPVPHRADLVHPRAGAVEAAGIQSIAPVATLLGPIDRTGTARRVEMLGHRLAGDRQLFRQL